MAWLLAKWKITAIGIAILCTFYAGWHSHTIYNTYILQKEEIKIIKKLGDGQNNIIKFNQDFDRVKDDAKDCINSTVPDSIIQLLH